MQFDYIQFTAIASFFLAVYFSLLVSNTLVKYAGAVYTLNQSAGKSEGLERFVTITNKVLGNSHAVRLLLIAAAITAVQYLPKVA